MPRFFRVHSYLIGDVIAKGNFASVRVCYRNGISKPLCAKFTPRDPRNPVRTLFNERILSGLLLHPHILQAIDVFDTARTVVLVAELCQRGDAVDFLSADTLSERACLRLSDDLLSAVEYLHMNHLCHRDIKLDNLLITDDYRGRLCDFGMATFTFDGLVQGQLGSVDYVAPEALKDEPYDGFAADVWSCGVSLYCLFTQDFPFHHEVGHWNYDRPPDYSLLPVAMRSIVSGMLSLDPAARPTIHEVRLDGCFGPLRPSPLPPFERRNFDVDDLCSTWCSQVAQIQKIGYEDCRQKLETAGPSIEKALYALLAERSVATTRLAFAGSGSVSHASLHPNAKLEKVAFPAKGCDVAEVINGFFLNRNGCVSSPVLRTRAITLNQPDGDVTLSFECVDCEDEQMGCELLVERSPVTAELMECLAKSFVKPPQQ
jgi:serine/threonine protein kinase